MQTAGPEDDHNDVDMEHATEPPPSSPVHSTITLLPSCTPDDTLILPIQSNNIHLSASTSSKRKQSALNPSEVGSSMKRQRQGTQGAQALNSISKTFRDMSSYMKDAVGILGTRPASPPRVSLASENENLVLAIQ